MKTKSETKKLVVEIPTWAWDRITKYLREELELPSQIIENVMVTTLLETWADDTESWFHSAIYPNRETALRVAHRFFERYPRNSPIELCFLVNGQEVYEEFKSHYAPFAPSNQRQKGLACCYSLENLPRPFRRAG